MFAQIKKYYLKWKNNDPNIVSTSTSNQRSVLEQATTENLQQSVGQIAKTPKPELIAINGMIDKTNLAIQQLMQRNEETDNKLNLIIKRLDVSDGAIQMVKRKMEYFDRA